MADHGTTEEREILTWQGFGDASRALSQAIVDSGWTPDLIVAIARGGMIPGGALAYAMGIKVMGAMNVEFYTGIGETLPEPQLLPPLMSIDDLEGKKVLVVDDVADSGKTLDMVMRLIRTHGLALGGDTIMNVDARSATIYTKSRSVITPDYFWKKTDRWINFPWSTLPVVVPADSNATPRDAA